MRRNETQLDNIVGLMPFLILGYSLLTPIIWGIYCLNQPSEIRQECSKSLDGFRVTAIASSLSLITSGFLVASGVLQTEEHATQKPADPAQLKR